MGCRWWVLGLGLWVPCVAQAEDASLAALLRKGPVVVVEEDAHGRYREATAVIDIDAPAAEVWEVLVAMDRYQEFVPRVTTSEVTRRSERSFDVRLVYDLPGPDTDYTARIQVDRANLRLDGTWLKDDLRGSSWSWRVVALGPSQSLLFHSLRVKNFSPLLQQVEDDQQSVTVGVNVSSALSTVKAVKRRAEKRLARR